MKNKKLLSLLIVVTSTCLCSCTLFNRFDPYQYDEEKVETKLDVETNIYYQKSSFDSIEYQSYKEGTKYISDLRSYNLAKDKNCIKSRSTGDIPLLVVPVTFTDVSEKEWKDKNIYIQNAFFGTSKWNNHYSVSEYYMKSSYGSLCLKGEVTNPFKVDDFPTIQTVETAILIRNEIINKLYDSRFDLTPYLVEVNGVKYIENLFLIYDYPYSPTGSDLWWAYSYNNTAQIADSDYYVNNTAWASINFASPKSNVVDAKTYIHEMGHLLGLEDYYSEDNYQPLGGFDVMDLNLGDHTAFSKLLLGWITPKIIHGEGKFTLRSFEDYGEVILIPKEELCEGQYTPFQEYLLLEFYTPTKLNFGFSEKYETKTGKIFQYPTAFGVKIYHVDARLAYFTKKTRTGEGDFIKLLSDNTKALPSSEYHVEYRYRNYNRRTGDGKNVLYHLIEKNRLNSFIEGNYATNDTVFKKHGLFSGYYFHDWTYQLYKFSIDSYDTNKANFTFYHKNTTVGG